MVAVLSGRKGSRYERELVRLVQEAGLPAHRVPLSGAMNGYDDDVVVCDTWRVECKYRRTGAGFSRLHDWLGTADALDLPASDLVVYSLDYWLSLVRARIDGHRDPVPSSVTKLVSQQKALIGWLGGAHFLAVRKPRAPWLIIERAIVSEWEAL